MKAFLQVWPANGQRFATAQEAKEAFKAGKDFSCSRQGGPYMSVRDFGAPSMTHFDGVKIVQNLPIIVTLVTKEECNVTQ
jgi:hypothetical protein